MFFLSHSVLEVVSSFFKIHFRYLVEFLLDIDQLVHDYIGLLHLFSENMHFLCNIMRTTSIWRNRAHSASDWNVSCPPTFCAFIVYTHILGNFFCIILVACAKKRIVILNCMNFSHRSFNRKLDFLVNFLVTIVISNLIITLIEIIVRLFKWKCMNSFERFSLNLDLFVVNKVSINATLCS